ncbi:MAG: GNAT family N-acetyltransferase [Candidatus Woesearchaeota archaeon]
MLKFKTVVDEKECRLLWKKFSPNELLWDLWDFRFCFYNDNFSFNFILGIDDGEAGILPLVFDKKTKVYTYFGENFPEQNRFLLNDKTKIKLFLENCPKDTGIYYIDNEEKKYYDLKDGDKRYFINLEKFNGNFENYLKSFNKKHRKNLNYDLKKLKGKEYVLVCNDIKDFKRLVELNKERFGKDSDYNEEGFVSGMSKLIDNALKLDILDITSIKIDNKTEAVGLGVFYNNIYYVLAVGRNLEVKNLGKLLIAEQIKSAINHKCNEIDFMSTEANWKELWNLDSEQMYEFEN